MAVEIERKFLIRCPDFSNFQIIRKMQIVQTYLIRNSENIQRRIRKITENGKTVCYYTEKQFITAVSRIENERIISEDEYSFLNNQADNTLFPIVKTRYVFDFREQMFELDKYDFSDEYAVLELEIQSELQEIILPPFIDVLKEVTDDGEYSNAVLGKMRRFPQQ